MSVRRIGSTIVQHKRPKARSAACGMARRGLHDHQIRDGLKLTPLGFRRLKRAIITGKGIWR